MGNICVGKKLNYNQHQLTFSRRNTLAHLVAVIFFSFYYAPINLKPGGWGGGRAWGGDLTFLKNLPSNSLPTGKPFQSNAQTFLLPGRHIAVNHSQVGCKKHARKTGKLYHFHFSTLLRLQRYYLIKIQSAFNTLCLSNYKINRFFMKQFVLSAKAAENITFEKSSHCSD